MAKFMCKNTNAIYVIKPITRIIVENQVVTQPGKRIQFENGELITDDEEVIKKLKENSDFNVILFEEAVEPQKKKKADAAE